MQQTIRERVDSVRERIESAAARAGRKSDDISLLAVSKFHPVESVLEAIEAGVTRFGENRVQEAVHKFETLESLRAGKITLDCVGHLQRNKAKTAVTLFSCIQSIDKLDTAEALSRAAADAGITIDILLELNTSHEVTKNGYENRGRLMDDAARIAALPGIRIRGVMTIAPFTQDEKAIRRSFGDLRETYEVLGGRHGGPAGDALSIGAQLVDTLSMGMTNDFEIAIEEGSNLVRIGTAIFGERPTP